MSLPVKEFWRSDNIWWRYEVVKLCGLLFWATWYICMWTSERNYRVVQLSTFNAELVSSLLVISYNLFSIISKSVTLMNCFCSDVDVDFVEKKIISDLINFFITLCDSVYCTFIFRICYWIEFSKFILCARLLWWFIKAIPPITACYHSVVCPSVGMSVTLVHPAKAVGRNEMSFGRYARVVRITLY